MDPRFQYVLDYFKQVYSVPPEIEIGYGTHDKKINIKKGSIRYFDTHDAYLPKHAVWKEWQSRSIPLLFDTSNEMSLVEIKEHRVFINYDILASSFFFLSGWQEYVFFKKNKVARFPDHQSLQCQMEIACLPVVHYYFDILKTAIERIYQIALDVKIWGDNPFALCLTHDVDKCQSGWLEDGFAVFKNGNPFHAIKFLFNRLFKEDNWFNFDEILELEKQYFAHSSFYFLPPNNRTGFFNGGDYNIHHKNIEKVFKKLREADFEVGLHGHFGTHSDFQSFMKDVRQFPFQLKGIRFHFLHFDITKTFDILEKAGLNYDSTLGFTEEAGFRNGIALPFYPYNFAEDRPYQVLEIPLHVMDASLRKKSKQSMDQIFSDIEKMMIEVQKWQGCLTLLWHNNYFSNYKYSGWKDLFEKILRKAKGMKALLLSGEEVYKRFNCF